MKLAVWTTKLYLYEKYVGILPNSFANLYRIIYCVVICIEPNAAGSVAARAWVVAAQPAFTNYSLANLHAPIEGQEGDQAQGTLHSAKNFPSFLLPKVQRTLRAKSPM